MYCFVRSGLILIIKMITAVHVDNRYRCKYHLHINKLCLNVPSNVVRLCFSFNFRLKQLIPTETTLAWWTGLYTCLSYCTAACQSSASRASDPESARPPTPPGVCCTSPSETHSCTVTLHWAVIYEMKIWKFNIPRRKLQFAVQNYVNTPTDTQTVLVCLSTVPTITNSATWSE